MTALLEPDVERPAMADGSAPDVPGPAQPAPDEDLLAEAPVAAKRRRVLLAVWVAALITGAALVIYGFGPLLEARQQRRLISLEKTKIDNAANESSGLQGVSTPTDAPPYGAPLGILEIGRLRLQVVVVEGARSAQTRRGPAHVAGSAGLGQPGNSVVVGRAHAYGGPFNGLAGLKQGDRILVTTTQGPSVYQVVTAGRRSLAPPAPGDAAGTASNASNASNGGSTSARSAGEVYWPSTDSRLTLLTSASLVPWNDSEATVVVATLQGLPFAPTPQNGRGTTGLGLDGDSDADAAVILSMLFFGATLSASIMLYRQLRPMTAYLLSIGPVTATAIIAGETLSRVFPGWM